MAVNDSAEKQTSSKTVSNSQRRYSSDEVADIIRTSLREDKGNSENTIDHDELIAIGKDVGVDQSQIDRAIERLKSEYQAKDKEAYLWSRFKMHFVLFAAISAFCVMINLVTDTESFWSAYVFLGWGLFLIGHYAGLRYAPEFVEMAMDKTLGITSPEFDSDGDIEAGISFTVSDPSGLMETEGLVSLSEENLIVEYQTADSVLGLLKTSVKEVTLDRSDILSIRLEQKFWNTELVIKGRSMKLFGGLPGNSSDTLRLAVQRQSHRAASALVANFKAS